MEIEFDPAKGNLTLVERGLDFLDALGLFDGDELTVPDKRFDCGEDR